MQVKNGNSMSRKNTNLLIDALSPYKEVKTTQLAKIAATKCHIVTTKCTKFDFRWGAATDPAWELTALRSPKSPSCI